MRGPARRHADMPRAGVTKQTPAFPSESLPRGGPWLTAQGERRMVFRQDLGALGDSAGHESFIQSRLDLAVLREPNGGSAAAFPCCGY